MSSGVNQIRMTTTKAFRVHHKDYRETNTGVTRSGETTRVHEQRSVSYYLSSASANCD